MIKLLMADDEPLVLVGLQSMLPWEEHGIEICDTPRNGGQALELIEQMRPDIVIADIKMPVMSGLELMDVCWERFGRLPLFIILTSVEDYQHVRQAMSGQAVDYLVKLELTPDMLLHSIMKAKDILHSLGRRESDSPIEQHGLQFLFDQFFMGLFTNQIKSADHLEQQKAELAIELEFDTYVVCCCQLERRSAEDTDAEHLMNLYSSTTRMVKEVVSQYVTCHITNIDLHRFAITFCLNKQEAEGYQQLLQDILEGAMQLVKNYFNVDLNCVVGTRTSTPLALNDSYRTAQKSMERPDMVRPIHFCQYVPKKSYVVEQIKEYIRKNLDKRLTLKEVSDAFGYSPKYVSLLFSKHAGYSFVEYINAERIARARKLLLASNVKIYEIAEQLGFENAFYFSKVFKKIEGISPREYMKMQSGAE